MTATAAVSRWRSSLHRGTAVGSVRRGILVTALTVLALVTAAPALAAPGTLDGVTQLGSGTQLFGVAVQSDGQIVAVGQSAGNIMVQRFSAAGQPTSQYVGPAGVANAVAIEPGGQIVVAGTTGGAMFAERLTSALAPDGSFGAGGIATAFGGGGAANAVAIGPGGTVVVAGSVSSGTKPAVARFTASGHLDGSFAGTGGIALDWGANSVAQGVAVQPDGRIVLVGRQNPGQPTNGVIARLTPSGSYDTSFAGTGILTYHYAGGGYTGLQAVAVQDDGKIVAAGVDSGTSSCNVCGAALYIRFNSDGSYDGSFGTGGVTALPAGSDQYALLGAYGVGIAGGGRIVGAGSYADTGTSVDAATWALTPGGSSDPAYGPSDVVRGPSGSYESCALAVGPDGTIVAAGITIVTQPETTPCTVRSNDVGFIARYEGFGPPPPPPALTPPTATTGPATAVGPTAATLTGQVNPEGSATSVHFDYGPTPAYGSSTPVVAAGSGATATPATAALAGLKPNTTYYYRLVATNSAGQTAYGAQASFTTTPVPGVAPPSVTTGAATRVTLSSARLAGTVNPHGATASYHFELGTSTSYGTSTSSASAGSGTSAVTVSATVRHLRAMTLYHYRLVATGPGGTATGRDRTFRTPAATLGASPRSISLTSLRRHGLTVTVTCARACSVSATLTISGATAHRLGLGSRTLVLARGKAHSRRAGVLHIHLTVAGPLPTLAQGKRISAQVTALVNVARRHVRLSRGLALTH